MARIIPIKACRKIACEEAHEHEGNDCGCHQRAPACCKHTHVHEETGGTKGVEKRKRRLIKSQECKGIELAPMHLFLQRVHKLGPTLLPISIQTRGKHAKNSEDEGHRDHAKELHARTRKGHQPVKITVNTTKPMGLRRWSDMHAIHPSLSTFPSQRPGRMLGSAQNIAVDKLPASWLHRIFLGCTVKLSHK